MSKFNPPFVTIPEVRHIRYSGEGAFRRTKDCVFHVRLEQPDSRILRLLQREFPGIPVVGGEAPEGAGYAVSLGASRCGQPADVTGIAVPSSGIEEGYELAVRPERIEVRAVRAAGLFYGLQTLRQLLDTAAGDSLPCADIHDWPDTARRGMHFDFRQTHSRLEKLEEAIAQFARFKINTLLIEYEDKFPFRCDPVLRHPKHAFTEEQLARLLEAAREHYIEVMPLQQTFGHLEYVLRHEAYAPLRETPESTGELCPCKPGSYELLTKMLDEIIAAHPDSPYVHLGCDEVYSLCECETCRERFGGSREAAFIHFVNRMIEYTAARGKQPVIWHDMLDKCPEDLLQTLDPRVAVMIWIYNYRNIEAEVSALTAKFRRLGIDVMGAPAVRCFDWAEHQNYPVAVNRLDNLKQWRDTAAKLDIDCVIGTNWTAAFSLGTPYGIFETTWYVNGYHADVTWNRSGGGEDYIDRFMAVFHGLRPAAVAAKVGRYTNEDYYFIIRHFTEEAVRHRDIAELIAVMHDFEVATDRSRAIHKYAYRWRLYPGDGAERRSLLNNYVRNRSGLQRVRPRMTAVLRRFQPDDMADHYVLSRFYLHDYLNETLYKELGLDETLLPQSQDS